MPIPVCYISGMFDPSILLALEPPTPPEMPRIAEERIWKSNAETTADREATRLAGEYEETAALWLSRLDAARVRYGAMEVHDGDPASLQRITDVIGRTEHLAEWRAKWRSRFATRAARENKKLFRSNPGLAAIEKPFVARLLATDDKVIEALLEHALFLRAIRSEWDPEARGGPQFVSASELRAHLRSELTA